MVVGPLGFLLGFLMHKSLTVFALMGSYLRACSRGIHTYKFCNSLRKSYSGFEAILGWPVSEGMRGLA